MGFIADVTQQIAQAIRPGRKKPLVVAYRSTFRPGTIEELVLPLFRSIMGDDLERLVEIVYNPEFLREGTAVDDFFAPPKIVIGTGDGKPNAVMDHLNAGIRAPVFNVGYRESEVTKFVDNTWHAVKVSFANEIGRMCLTLGISVQKVHEIFVSDNKLNISPSYLRPGGPFGGSCLPKDVRALQHIASDAGVSLQMIDSVLRSNEAHKHRMYEYAVAGLQPGSYVLLAGLAFKAGTDDLRESPNVDLARKLLAGGFRLEIYDPAIEAAKLVGANLGYAYSQLPALEQLLVDRVRAEAADYDRVIATNATISSLNLGKKTEIRNIGVLP
jgi:GDP-mannose 6-dehydrogenase